jgi:hypothetical protein
VFLTGDIPGLLALYNENATFTPQMGLEGKAPLVTPKGTFKPAELPGFFAALAAENDFPTATRMLGLSAGFRQGGCIVISNTC